MTATYDVIASLVSSSDIEWALMKSLYSSALVSGHPKCVEIKALLQELLLINVQELHLASVLISEDSEGEDSEGISEGEDSDD